MQYKGHLCSLGPKVLSVVLGRATNEDVAEVARKDWIGAMRGGDHLLLDIDRTKPDFREISCEGTFIAEEFFNYEYFKEHDNLIKYVRESENHGIGGINPGIGYCRAPDFTMSICSSADDEATI